MRVYTRSADGVKGVVSRVYADGRAERFEYMANFGKDIMVTGIPDYDSVTLRKVDDLTSDAVLSHAGKEAVIAVLNDDHFFGEGCLAGQPFRMATASAMVCPIARSSPRA